jgi:hypothetical protein
VQLSIVTKDRGIVKLGEVINDSQEQLIAEIEHQLNTNGKIRIITLKARQMGISTVIEGVIFTLTILHPNFQSLIVSHEQESSEHILGMTKRYWSTFPFKKYHTEKYVSRKQLAWSDLDSQIVVATARNTDAGRSKTLHALHASEVAFWDDPETLMDGLRQSIPDYGLSAIFLESTANGIGNYFYQTWIDAVKGESEYKAMFFPWHQFPEYTAAYIDTDQQAKHALSNKPLDEEELALRSMGVSDQRLVWRRWAIINKCRNNLDKFKQEYPATWHEAFLSTGLNVFRKPDLDRHYRPFTPETGYLRRNERGDVVFVKNERGPLKIYRKPAKDKNWGVYQIGADPTHTVVGDYACGQVISRRTLEQVAVYKKKCNPMDFARDLELLGEYYNMATIAPEKTGPGFGTVAYLKARGYPAVWESVKMVNSPGQVAYDTWGWVSNMQTKQMAINHLVDLTGQALSETEQATMGLVIHDEDTYDEMVSYIRTDNGGFENGAGNDHDDTVMAIAIAITTHLLDPPLVPYQRDTSATEMAQQVASLIPEAVRRTALTAGQSTGQDQDGHSVLVAPAPTVQDLKESTERSPAWEQWDS